jgi:hypothetical protein
MELNKKVGVPIGLIHSSYGGSAVEDWISNETLNANGGATNPANPCPGPVRPSMGLPSQQYNGQIRPLVNMTLKGAIWYVRFISSLHEPNFRAYVSFCVWPILTDVNCIDVSLVGFWDIRLCVCCVLF